VNGRGLSDQNKCLSDRYLTDYLTDYLTMTAKSGRHFHSEITEVKK